MGFFFSVVLAGALSSTSTSNVYVDECDGDELGAFVRPRVVEVQAAGSTLVARALVGRGFCAAQQRE
jgi:hypothetical protein